MIGVTAFFVSGASAQAGDEGGWVSSGGEVFRFVHNPWFLDRNTTRFEYCISLDAATVTADLVSIRAALTDAISYWREELSEATQQQAGPGFASFGKAQWVEVPCTSQPPLRIVFGVGGLQADESAYLNRVGGVDGLRSYIGVSVRQSYDLQTLRGSGFVYIASDLGPGAYKNPGHLIDRAWSRPKLLTYALIHELGHVFGFPHSGVGIMSETFLDHLLHTRFSGFYEREDLIRFLAAPRTFRTCTWNGFFDLGFFQVAPNTTCLHFERESALGLSWLVRAETSAGVATDAGRVRLTASQAREFGQTPAITVHLPEGQSVFSAGETFYNNYIIGPVFANLGAHGFFRTASSAQPHTLYAEVRADSVTLVAERAGKLTPVLVYAPPTLLNSMIVIQKPQLYFGF